MSDEALEQDNEQEFSLADLAGLDVSEIQEIRSERIPDGAYIFRGKKATLSDMLNRDGEKRFVISATIEVAEVKAVIARGVNPEDVMGKTYTEKFYIVPEKAAEGIGRVRAWYTDIGLDSSGPLGGLTEEGHEPGMVDRIVDHLFPAKIVSRKGNDGESYARLKLPATKKAA